MRNSSIRWHLAKISTVAALTGSIAAATAGAAQADTTPSPAPPTDRSMATTMTPQIPVIVAGKRYSPQDFARIAPTVHFFTVSADDLARGVMHGYTDKSDYDRAAAQMDRQANELRAQHTRVASTTVTYYEDIYYSGDRFTRGPYEPVADLRTLPAHCTIIPPVCTANWNDRISSLTTGAYNTRLFADIEFGGDQIVFPAYRNIGDLRLYGYGWNDRASSVTSPA
ncbi:hypothetical protein EV385_5293 [Krasilnikovia cinnamomea]|uniref:Peptidase inhibitor family I36 n=1 Tax=Krasilnikovia cinnamomea TaxID=349313 RepID=A0A4Q7ZQH1_9ACTN|nr:hypothetical protein [Krasilnikovia cinnamomea]RZU53372.1 hypothetical protein EV385_5293 [Krasilnikovia cinnamomea]